jgi:hypothetical protein
MGFVRAVVGRYLSFESPSLPGISFRHPHCAACGWGISVGLLVKHCARSDDFWISAVNVKVFIGREGKRGGNGRAVRPQAGAANEGVG